MSRYERESKMKALLGQERYGEVLVTELGGRKRDRKKMVMDGLEKSYRGATKDASYQKGSVSEEAPFNPMIESSRRGIPSWMHRKVMNALPTLAGLGVGLARGADFGPGPDDTIIARYEDESGTQDPQTLGEVMILPEGHSGPTIQQHELGHVSQGRYFGPLLPAVALGSLALQGSENYEDFPLEASAMEMGKAEMEGRPSPAPMLEHLRRSFRRQEKAAPSQAPSR